VHRRAAIAVGASLVLITINLRLALGSVSPVLDDIRETLGLSSSTAGLLTTAPVLCFGLAAPLAPQLARRFGQEALLLFALLGVIVGLLLRVAVESVGLLFAGTLLLGVTIAVANVLMPSIIKRRFVRPGLMMGLFTMSLSVSAALGAAFTVPLEEALGGWRPALATWALPAVLAVVLWAPEVRRSGSGPSAGSGGAVRLWHDRTAWLVTGVFALQSLLFFSLLSWTPDILRDAGLSSSEAGAWLSVSMLCGIAPSLVLPAIAERMRDQRLLAVVATVPWAFGLVGLLMDPAGATWLWMLLTGIGQGAGISLVLTLVVLRAPDAEHAAALSGMAQGLGYTIAALGPLLLGVVRDATGDWDAPIMIMLVVSVGMLLTGLGAVRDRFVSADPIPPTGGSSRRGAGQAV
jgi:MFS transporter, CP family, cyanate transporter